LEFRLASSRLVLHRHDDPEDPLARARRDLPALERAVREAPEEPFHLYNLGTALHRLGLHADAEVALLRAIKRAPRRILWGAPARTTLAGVVAAQGRPRQAVKLCQVATKLAPDWARGWCLLGGALADVGRVSEALDAYQRALDCAGDAWPEAGVDETAWQVRAGLGRIHLARGEVGEAIHLLSSALADNPANADLRVALARVMEAAGRSGDAQAQFERVLSEARAGPEAYIGLSDFFAGKAEAALVRGLADHPESRSLLERIERLRAAQAMT
jgi:tetratricopeptide (TPR) repeat protein